MAPDLHVGAQLAYEPGRDPNESDFLKYRGVPGVNRGASYGLHLEWDHKFGPMPVTVLARVRKHTDSDRGTQGDLRVSGGLLKYQAFSMGAFVQGTWASEKAADSFYGVSLPVATATGLPAYSAGSGFLYGSAGLLWSLDLAPEWALVGNLEARRLTGDARDSPLVQRASSYYAAAGIVYRFK
jgi:outer membrane scaffolding protein for murein synthesis (MipA/OmpV family)